MQTEDDLVSLMKPLGALANDLMTQAANRQRELKDPRMRDELAAARAELKKQVAILVSSSKTLIHHADCEEVNRDVALRQVCFEIMCAIVIFQMCNMLIFVGMDTIINQVLAYILLILGFGHNGSYIRCCPR